MTALSHGPLAMTRKTLRLNEKRYQRETSAHGVCALRWRETSANGVRAPHGHRGQAQGGLGDAANRWFPQLMNRDREANVGSEVTLTPRRRSPASSPGVGMCVV